MLMVFFVSLIMAVNRIWRIHLGNFAFSCNWGFCFSHGNLLARRGWSWWDWRQFIAGDGLQGHQRRGGGANTFLLGNNLQRQRVLKTIISDQLVYQIVPAVEAVLQRVWLVVAVDTREGIIPGKPVLCCPSFAPGNKWLHDIAILHYWLPLAELTRSSPWPSSSRARPGWRGAPGPARQPGGATSGRKRRRRRRSAGCLTWHTLRHLRLH